MNNNFNKSIKVNVVLNLIKQACTILFPLITIPYITRIIGVDGYGQFNYAHSIVNYFILISGLGFSTYAIREGSQIRKNKVLFKKFVDEIFTLNVLSTIVSIILLYTMTMTLDGLYQYRLIIIILSFNIITNTVGMDWINSVYEDYLYITLRYIIIQTISLFLMICFVRDGKGVIAYSFIFLFSQSASNLFNIFYVRKHVHIKLTRIADCYKHLMPVLILFFNNLATTIYVNSDITILGIFRSDYDVGLYSGASKIYTAAKMLAIAGAVVTIPRLSYYVGVNDNKKYNELLTNILEFLISLTIPLFTGLFMVSKEVLFFVFGEDITGYSVLQILCIASIFSILAYFVAQCILIPNKREKFFLYATLLGAFSNLILNFILIPYSGYVGAALTTLLSEFLVMLLCFVSSKKLHDIRLGKKVISSICVSCFYIIFVCMIGRLFKEIWIRMIFDIILSGIGYVVIMVWMDNPVISKMHNSVIDRVNR